MEVARIYRPYSASMSNVRSALPFLGIILGVLLTLAGHTVAQDLAEREWSEDTIVYQIWPKSFQDSDGDGTGDIQGVISRLDYIAELGVKTIWLNTIYPSPLADSGYDVSDFKSIDSTYGDLNDFDELITAAHDSGLKVILDFIPNHSSIEHPWFNESVYQVDPYTDYYVWHNGSLDISGNNVAPNNWESVLSNDGAGSAWEWNEIRQEWYLHQFSTGEADFDLRNEAVLEELLDVLDFWLNRGVDGFYVNGVPYFLEDAEFTDNPTGSLNSTFGLSDNVALLYKFREHIDSWVSLNGDETKFLVAEGFENDESLIAYYGNDTSDGIAPVNTRFITDFGSTSNASYIKSTIDAWISALPVNQTTTWQLSNQNHSRIATRYGLNRADGLNMLVMSLPGRVLTYYGEEIAMMDNEDITYAETVDPLACASGEAGYSAVSRDPYRTPMQWTASTGAGFTTASSSYLPIHTNYLTRNVATQLASESSNIRTYKPVAALRSKPAFAYGSYEIQALNDDRVLVLRRYLEDYPTYILVINVGLARQTVDLTEVYTDLPTALNISVLSANAVLSGTTATVAEFTLTANAAVILTDDIVEAQIQTGKITNELDWWQNGVIYQIYTKSFQDSNDDGIGDLQGIISRLDYLKDTGVTAFTLTPIYTSPQIDGGYDISNFVDIDPIFGSLEDFQELVNTTHEKNLKLILDFVPNHSSDEHVWFQNSVARIEPYTDYYVWRDGISTENGTQPPNNWLSVFGGSAWTWNERRQQYYLHQFHTSQPDLNLRNPTVVAELTKVLIFWLDRGVDGFRISSVAHLFEDANFADEPLNENPGPNVIETDHDYLEHIHTTDLDETIEIVYQWRTIVDEYAAQSDGVTRILITDSAANLNILSRYFGNQTHEGAHLPLNFAFIANLTQQSSASSYINAFNEWFATVPESCTSNWILGSHDHRRVGSRFGLNRVDGLNMLLHLLPGTAFPYMGEELALLDTAISFNDTQDPHAINAGPERFNLFTRDPARTPYQWDSTNAAGFSNSNSTWLPVNDNYRSRNLAAQIALDRSNYLTHKAILELKQSDTIRWGTTQFASLNSDTVLVMTRELPGNGSYAIIINLGLGRVTVDISALTTYPTEDVYVLIASANSIAAPGDRIDVTAVPLSANAALVLYQRETETASTTPEPEVGTTGLTTTTISPTTQSPATPILVNDEILGELDWWQEATIYQIYPKSFQDSDGDGIGDLRGIISRVDHLAETGITAIWLNSIFESPQIDGGFDISDFTRVDPIFGTIEDFGELIRRAHARAMKVILDFVPNHSSDEHVWFRNSVARIEPYTDYYVWRDGISSENGTQPPNNWLSVYGGPAWTWNERRQQYYLHQFHTSQPDLNLRNPTVVAELTKVLIFWLDRGVDGFRISSVAHLFEDANFADEPLNENPGPNVIETDHDYLEHIHTTDLDETIEIVYQWRTIVDEYVAQSDGETRILITDSAASQDIVSRYFGNQTHQGAHLPLNFAIVANLTRQSSASSYLNALNGWFATLPENRTSNWVLGNHDHRRVTSRFSLNQADGLNMLKLLPGTSFTYMGEELALLDTQIAFTETQDPHAINAGPNRFHLFTRDPARTPYHWNNSTSGGFSSSTSTWLPINSNYLSRNLASQISADRSNFNTHKAIVEFRRRETIKRGATRFLALNNDRVLAFTRELEGEAIFAIVINLGLLTVNVDLSEFSNLPSEGIRVCLASANAIITTGTAVDITAVPLSANAAVVLCNAEIPETTTSRSTTAITTTVDPNTTTESSTISTTTTQSESEEDTEEDGVWTTTEDPNGGTTAIQISSVLLAISLWNILLEV